MTTRHLFGALLAVIAFVLPGEARAQQVVIVTLPAAVSFAVSNVGQATTGSPAPTRASFVVVNLSLFTVLRVSVRADADFTPPGGPAIPAARVSWTTANPTGVVGSSGTLNTVSFGQVFQMLNSLVSSGGVDVQWTLAPPAVDGLRAGTHTAVVRWRLEAVVP